MKMFFLFFAMSLSSSLNAWVWVGNGGDTIYCRPSLENQFSGHYALDYLATYTTEDIDLTPAEVSSWRASMQRIEELLASAPGLEQKFKEFRANLFNTSNLNAPFVWQQTGLQLVDILDEELLLVDMPENCKIDGKPKKFQTVIRQSSRVSGFPVWKVQYHFDQSMILKLQQQDAIQLSFLLVHEFLWNFTTHVQANRAVTRYLHSQRVDKHTHEERLETLKSLGLMIPKFQEDVLTQCGNANGRLSDIFQLSRDIQMGKHLELKLQLGRRDCHVDFGCSGEFTHMTMESLLPESVKIVSLVYTSNELYLSFRIPQISPRDIDLICKYNLSKNLLHSCKSPIGAGTGLLQQLGNNFANMELKGRFSPDRELCLVGENYQKKNDDIWNHNQLTITSTRQP